MNGGEDMDRRCRIRGYVPSHVDYLQSFLAGTMDQIKEYVTDEDLIFDIKLIIDELVVNGAMHGNGWNESKRVFLKIELDPDELIILVQDEGKGVEYSTDQYDCTQLKCSGRGLVIVEALTDSINYEGNRICCKKKINI